MAKNLIPGLLISLLFAGEPEFCRCQAQESTESKAASLEIGFARTNLKDGVYPGMAGHYLFFLTKSLGTGFALASYQNYSTNTFGYPLSNPQMLISQYGWINQWLPVHFKLIKLKLSLNTGLIQARLFDDTQRYYNGQLNFQQETIREFFCFIQPSADLSLRLFGPVHLTAGANYRFAGGKSHFTPATAFKAPGYFLGLTVIAE